VARVKRVIPQSMWPRWPLSLPGTAVVGRFAAEALQERWEQVGQALLVIRSRVHLSLWRQFVDDFRQIFGQKMRGLRGIDAYFRRERIDLVRTQHFLNLVGGNWLVFSHPDPGGKRATLAALREFARQTLQSAALSEEATKNPDERIRSARRISFSEYRIE
jgi:hypothetical protein